MPHLLSPDLIPLLWSFHLGKLPLLVSGSSSVSSATAYRGFPGGLGFLPVSWRRDCNTSSLPCGAPCRAQSLRIAEDVKNG